MHIFISRNLRSDSLFFKLEALEHTLHHQSLVRFSPIDFVHKTDFDWIFFYSQNGIKYYFKKENYNSEIKYGLMGPVSGHYFESITGHEADFIGSGNADGVIHYFNNLQKPFRIDFITAENSLNAVAKKLDSEIVHHSIPVYKNETIQDIPHDDFDILVFTSPLNAKAYLESKEITTETVFAIGSTTARFIKNETSKEVLFCQQPSEKNLFNLIQKYLKERPHH